jgi:hypothetical protein
MAVEGAAIVVSILMAFGIDAAWDRHVERREEAEILSDLSSEVRRNLRALDGTMASHQRVIDATADLVAVPGSELRGMPAAELRPFFYALMSRVSFTPVDGTLESALSSGKLIRIQNDSIRNGMVTWRGLVRDTEEEVVELRQATRELVEYTRGKGILSVGQQYVDRGIGDVLLAEGLEPGDVLADLTQDPAFIDLVLWEADGHWEYLNELSRLRDLLSGINDELSAEGL